MADHDDAAGPIEEGIEECPDCPGTALIVRASDDIVLYCPACDTTWRHALGYLVPVPPRLTVVRTADARSAAE